MEEMAEGNHTVVTDLLFQGFMDLPELQVPLFVLFPMIYVITLAGNLGMIVLIRFNSGLQTSRYYFLSSLSLADVGNASVADDFWGSGQTHFSRRMHSTGFLCL